MAKRGVPLQTGIEFVKGLPGGGKSYYAVSRLLRVILWQRRPIYTNLPIKYRVLRRYLIRKGGRKLARYINPVTKEHLDAFFHRAALLGKWRDEGGTEADFIAQHGPHVISGKSANWIPYGAVIIIDEAHRWYPQRDQKTESKAIMDYLTMHRHFLHWWWFLTQHPMNVSLTFRRLADTYIECTDKSRLPFLFGLKLPIKAFCYEEYPGCLVDDGRPQGVVKPIRVWTEIPALSRGLVWRLYSSHVHAGSYRRLANALEESRRAVEGEEYEPPKAEKQRDGIIKRIKSKLARFARWAVILGGVYLVFLLVVNLGGKSGAPEEPERSDNGPVAVSTITKPVEDKPKPEPKEPESTPVLEGVGKGFVVIDGQVIRLGEFWKGLMLGATENEQGIAVFAGRSGVGLVWYVGGTPQLRVPSISESRGAADHGSGAGRTTGSAGSGGVRGEAEDRGR